MALKLVLRLAQEFGLSQIQLFGDSLLVIQCLRKETTLVNFTLPPLYDGAQILMTTFSHISLSYIYKVKNMIAYELSKDGLGLDQRSWIILKSIMGAQLNILMNLDSNLILV